MKSITLKPEMQQLHALNDFIQTVIGQKDFQVDLIVEEIFTNIVNYSKTEFITVNAEYADSTLTLEFVDNGLKFNPLLKKDYEAPETIDDAQIGGLGILFAKEMADELDYHYENDENHLKIIKKVE